MTDGHCRDILRAGCAAGQPAPLFRAFGEACDRRFGHSLFTVLAWDAARDAIQRIHTSDPLAYPIGAWKKMGSTAWGAVLLKGGEAILCRDEEHLRWAFPDADLLVSLGCGANMSAPVRFDGRVLGVASICGPARAYGKADLDQFDWLSQSLSPSLLAAMRVGSSLEATGGSAAPQGG